MRLLTHYSGTVTNGLRSLFDSWKKEVGEQELFFLKLLWQSRVDDIENLLSQIV
jgi:hypothetical protein